MKPSDKGAGSGGEVKRLSPDPPLPDETPFQRFEAFARKVINTPRAVVAEREREWKEQNKKALRKQGNKPSSDSD